MGLIAWVGMRMMNRSWWPTTPSPPSAWGVSRSLRFRPKPAPAGPGDTPPLSLELADGDLLVMEAPTQQHWLHALPERRRVLGERINLTFRQLQVA